MWCGAVLLSFASGNDAAPLAASVEFLVPQLVDLAEPEPEDIEFGEDLSFVGNGLGIVFETADKAAERKIAPEGVPQRVWRIALKFETENVPAHVLCAIAKVESDFDYDCITGNCYGLMQVHKVWEFHHFEAGEEWDDPYDNMRVAAIVLNGLYDQTGSLHKMLMMYNEGNKGNRSGTSAYSRKVMRWAEKYKK